MMTKRILHIIENLDDEYGGPAKSVPSLVYALSKYFDNTIVTTSRYSKLNNESLAKSSLNVYSFKCSIFKIYFSYSLLKFLIKSISSRNYDLVHFHSIWTLPTWIGYLLCRFYSIPYVISARSNFYKDSLVRGSFKKKFILKTVLKGIFDNCSFIHVTAKDEEVELNSIDYKGQVVLSPNGIDYDAFDHENSQESFTYLYMGRIHPRKNLDILIDAFIKFKINNSNWSLQLCGPIEDQDYFNFLKRKVENSGMQKDVKFNGMLVGEERIKAFTGASCLVLASKFENFGMVIGEAMAAGKPVIVSEGTPWQIVESRDAGFWIKADANTFAKAMKEFSELPCARRLEMGSNARAIIVECFSWEKVVLPIVDSYREILDGDF
jgi:glycosyltransferase involved in cell wall biosynthesis